VSTFLYPRKGLLTDIPKSKFAEFKEFIEFRIKVAVKQCYEHFVTLMLPIISQANLNLFLKKFVVLMPLQFLVLWMMLNFNGNGY
jgi:hypothetical protein